MKFALERDYSLESLITCLNNLTLGDLNRKVGTPVTELFDKLQIYPNKELLVDILIGNEGLNLLNDKKFRELLIEKNEALLNDRLNGESISKLKWNRNNDKALIVEAFGGDISQLSSTSNQRDLLSHIEREIDYDLFEYQNWMRNSILKFLVSDKNSTLVHMPTGSGKTRTSISAVIDFIRHRSPEHTTIVWLAHSDELCEQAIEEFIWIWKHIGILQCNVWRMWGGIRALEYSGEGNNFIVTSFQTAYRWVTSSQDQDIRAFADISNKNDLLIVDEAHMSTAPTYKLVIDSVCSMETKKIGLTATPGRDHVGETSFEGTRELKDFFENQLIEMKDNYGKSSLIQFLKMKKS